MLYIFISFISSLYLFTSSSLYCDYSCSLSSLSYWISLYYIILTFICGYSIIFLRSPNPSFNDSTGPIFVKPPLPGIEFWTPLVDWTFQRSLSQLKEDRTPAKESLGQTDSNVNTLIYKFFRNSHSFHITC